MLIYSPAVEEDLLLRGFGIFMRIMFLLKMRNYRNKKIGH